MTSRSLDSQPIDSSSSASPGGLGPGLLGPGSGLAQQEQAVVVGEQQDDHDNDSGKLFTIGILADIQYAPIPDGTSYSGVPRYYRHALHVARYAAQHFERDKVDIVMNLGDIIDGSCSRSNTSHQTNSNNNVVEGEEKEEYPGHRAVDEVMKALSIYKNGPIIHTHGNHCLYNLDRETLKSKLGIPFFVERDDKEDEVVNPDHHVNEEGPSANDGGGELVGYYSQVFEGIRFVILDSYDISMTGRCKTTSNKYKLAYDILCMKNPNVRGDGDGNENSPEGIEGNDRRFVAFNGALGMKQLLWLQDTLYNARQMNEKVIIISHQPIHPESTKPICLIWNYFDVLTILRKYNDIILASFSGHAHKGGYIRDTISGIHFRVFEAVLETSPPNTTYAIIDIYNNHMNVHGFGSCISGIYSFDHHNNQHHQSMRSQDQDQDDDLSVSKSS